MPVILLLLWMRRWRRGSAAAGAIKVRASDIHAVHLRGGGLCVGANAAHDALQDAEGGEAVVYEFAVLKVGHEGVSDGGGDEKAKALRNAFENPPLKSVEDLCARLNEASGPDRAMRRFKDAACLMGPLTGYRIWYADVAIIMP